MRKADVSTPSQALAFLTDCNIATVTNMAMKKSRPAGEYSRQVSICQQAIDWMVAMKVDMKGTRAQDIIDEGLTVEQWAEQYQPQAKLAGVKL